MINAAPLLHLLAPSMESGPDYATTVLGAPWNFDDGSMIVRAEELASAAPIPTVTWPQSRPPATPRARRTAVMPTLWLRVSPDPSKYINPNRFKYFTIRYRQSGQEDLAQGRVQLAKRSRGVSLSRGGCALATFGGLSYTIPTMLHTDGSHPQPIAASLSRGTPLVSIVVVNYNGHVFLPQLLKALDQQTLRDFELVFVDNGSQDASVPLVAEMCQELRLPLRLIRNQSNQGFARGCNQGIEQVQAPWIATLNNDTQPEACWLERLLSCVTSQPDLGMIAGKLLFVRETGQINSAGIAVDWAGIAWDWRGGEVDCPQENGFQEIFGPCAGAALYARRMLEHMGGFDNDFFAYLEDVDLAWRARLAGWRCIFQPQARTYHYHSATLGDPSSRKSFLLGRNKVWLIAKNYPAPWLARFLPLIIAYDLMAIAYGLARTGDLALLRGRIAGLRGIRPFMAKRRAIQCTWHDTQNWARMMRPLAPPWSVPRRYAHLYRSSA